MSEISVKMCCKNAVKYQKTFITSTLKTSKQCTYQYNLSYTESIAQKKCQAFVYQFYIFCHCLRKHYLMTGDENPNSITAAVGSNQIYNCHSHEFLQ